MDEPDDLLLNAPTGTAPVDASERDAREATELVPLDRLLRNASSSRQLESSVASKKPANFVESLVHGVSKFWRHQISVIVPHDKCRDHLGTSSSLPAATSSHGLLLWSVSYLGSTTELEKSCLAACACSGASAPSVS